jgi:hypothetical protein
MGLDFDWIGISNQAKAIIDMIHDSFLGTVVNVLFIVLIAGVAVLIFWDISSTREAK